MKVFLGFIFFILYVTNTYSAEPAWWSQQKKKCGLPSNLAYNTWVSQGSPCQAGASNGSTRSSSIGNDIGTTLVNGITEAIEQSDNQRKQRQQDEKRLKEESLKRDEIENENKKNRLQAQMLEVTPGQESASSGLTLMRDDENVNEALPSDEAAYEKGLSDATQCFSSSAGNHCANAEKNMVNVCLENYRAGYLKGEIEKKSKLQRAHQEGARAKKEGRKNTSFTHTEASGPCRHDWINAYNAGYTNR